MTPDLDHLTRLAHAATQGGRTVEPHMPYQSCMVNDAGLFIAGGHTPDIELAAALTPSVVLWLVEMARRAWA